MAEEVNWILRKMSLTTLMGIFILSGGDWVGEVGFKERGAGETLNTLPAELKKNGYSSNL